MEHYKVTKIDEKTYQIREEEFVNTYLLLGTDAALLIDTGNGSGNLMEVIRKLTDLPVWAVVTHGHADHLGGAGWFEKVLIHEADLALVYRVASNVFASRIAAKMFGVAYHFTRKPYKTKLIGVSLPLILDFGDRTLEAIHLPGHTAGSIGLWDKENHQVFCGDAVGTMMQMMSPGTLSLEVLMETIDKMLELVKDNTIWWGHYEGLITETDLINLKKEIREIMSEQPCNTKRGTVKTSRNSRITYRTNNIYTKK